MVIQPQPDAIHPGEGSLAVLHLGQVLGALSHALDLTEGQPKGHCVRSCWIGMRIARRMGLSEDEAADLYYTLLLKDLGCSSNAARICQLYLADDRSFKQGFKTVNGSIRQALAFVVKHTGADADLMTRLGALANVLRNSDEIVGELIETRCHQGAEIAGKMGFSRPVCAGIQSLDEHWDGGGRPAGLAGEAIPLLSRIALLAQVIDVFQIQSGPEAAMREVAGRAGRWFDPHAARAALACGAETPLWDELRAPALAARVFAAEPSLRHRAFDDDMLDDVVHGFARVIDAKSPFTHGHSARVALYTDLICAELGYTPDKRRWMRRAALMHDIGKLGVSNRILDKPARLSDEEFAAIKRHPVMGEEILEQVDHFRPMARLAAAHHERLDGKGYPRGLSAPELTRDMRMLTVADIFDALTAERPYREAMPLERTFAIMDDMEGSAIDPDCYAALKRAVAAADFLRFA
jgi:putative nucleotidyltransferase with HDIG domain